MVNASTATKNIWVAASDGDIERVKSYIESGMSPNVKDQNSYTPMHAAASYHHQELLEYLISVGGDINLPDDEGETPLYSIESVEMARWMIERGADPCWKNNDDQTPADYLEDDHPEISAYLRTFERAASGGAGAQGGAGVGGEMDDSQIDALAEEQTNRLMEESRRIMEEAERDGTNPDERLRALVENAMKGGLDPSALVGAGSGAGDKGEGQDRKRTRTD